MVTFLISAAKKDYKQQQAQSLEALNIGILTMKLLFKL